MDIPDAPLSERVLFNPLKLDRQRALATIQRFAEVEGLRIDSIEERHRRLSIEMRVTVTGDQDSIKSFAEDTRGRREGEPPRTLRQWIAEVLLAAGPWW